MAEKKLIQYVHHIHYVVHNRDEMVKYIEKNFGMKPDDLIDYKDAKGRGMKDAIYDIGKTHIQITQALDPSCKIAQHLAKCGPGVYHVAWGVEGIDKLAKDLAGKGNKMTGNEGITQSSRGYKTANIDTESSLGVWFQFAEGDRQTKR